MLEDNRDRYIFDLQEKVSKFLPSQREFLFSPASYIALMGGWGSGKITIGSMRGLVLSTLYPGNVGLVGRYHATDLEDSTLPTFFGLCPPSWIRHWKKARKILTLRNGSQILFRHIHDPNPKRRHITSTNLGWFFIDQLEEIDVSHWNTLIGRLRLSRAKKRFGFGAGNPNGKDWIYDTFFPDFREFLPGEFFQTYSSGGRLGIAVRSEENKKSNGGFVDDDYFDSLRQQMQPEWIARYLDCSFNDFTGRIYREYNLASVHNIDSFPIPSHWNIVVGIDVGGSHPWGVSAHAVDELGNVVTFACLKQATIDSAVIAGWIKANLPWNERRVSYIIDYENKLAMFELGKHGIHARPAVKKVNPGIIKVGGYMHSQEGRPLPSWYEETQSPAATAKWRDKSPRWFVMRSPMTRALCDELDKYVWDDKTGKPKNATLFDLCDSMRYAFWVLPQPSPMLDIGMAQRLVRREFLKKVDPGSAQEWAALDRRIKARKDRQFGTGMGELDMNETPSSKEPVPVESRGWEF